jgi:integrase
MDSAQSWSDFRNSWVNLNPLHNRKPVNGVLPTDVLVGPATAKRLLGQLREFHRFCIGRRWLSDEWAAWAPGKRYLKVITRVEPKEPFSDGDVTAIFKAVKWVTDRNKSGQQNAKELLVFCYVLRYSGLRISDAVKLEQSSLVPRPGDPENYALHVFMKKTKKWVYIPIPSGDIPGEPDVAAALRSLPLKHAKYFFFGGTGTPKTNETSWSNRLTRLFGIVQKRGLKLSVHATPHRFRHTFAARLLQSGMTTRDVAEYLGDTEEVVRTHYAKYTTSEQEMATAKWKKAKSRAQQDRQNEFRVIHGGKK